jgi:signal transduction histidine kinase
MAWMDELRRQGVTSVRDHVGEDLEAIRAIVPMIRIVAANPATVRAVGLPLDEMLGPIDPRIVTEGSQTSWLAQLEAVWHGRPVAHTSFTAATPTGRSYDAESTLSAPIIDGEPDFTRAVFTLIDVTDYRNEERRMQDLMEAKNQFLASVSHEIRTPLTAILGFARILEDEVGLGSGEREQMVSSIVQHSQEMADLVEDLLVAARTEMGQIEVVNETIDAVDQVRRTLDAGGTFTEGIEVDFPPGPARAIGDPARVRQILRNLLTNAERYGGPDVSVTVTSSPESICIEVADDGPGLPLSAWEEIFELYHRAQETPDQPGSVGIGLAVSRQLAELMGGTLEYRHQAGLSIFRLLLKRAS